MSDSSDSLWIGVDSVKGPDEPVLNVFRKIGNGFELVKIISGDEALLLYGALTEGGEESLETEVKM